MKKISTSKYFALAASILSLSSAAFATDFYFKGTPKYDDGTGKWTWTSANVNWSDAVFASENTTNATPLEGKPTLADRLNI